MKKFIRHSINNIFLYGSVTVVCLFLVSIIFQIFSRGLPVISWEFIADFPKDGLTKGGIFPAIAGTILLTFITTLLAVPFGIACAIYLSEYAHDNWLTRLIRAAIRNLAGIPSIIYGLFGLALFVQALQMGTSLLASGFTLGLLSLPYIITTSEESLRRVPTLVREGSLALGATQLECIRDVVLPAALPGILTGVILSLSRAAGETAPILFTGAVFYINSLPGQPTQEFMALPYHLYMLSTQHQSIELVRPLAYGTATVLIVLVFLLNIIAFYIRFKKRNYE
ncbi:phosphate ABC transporter permease PstA [Flavihumibacter fluvii]|uniref:phosphate ABC transporter permease PstA n=1 Tax=Flavihumibacter fluvii TaxID=2838157 RepID=UPI001BDEB5FF|nr:phosphate ABC transporter permease PstA [Flavihumibacter fluvii]ULQ54697.1 phosphate ABC transporter permease PstA [Flavihumibacter fluvii]